MKTKNNIKELIFSFLISAVLSAITFVTVKYYIPFSNETAGSYAVADIFGDSIKIFLIKILSVAAGCLAFITFLLKSRNKFKSAVLFPGFMIAFGILWIILPFFSSYIISRFTGMLIVQSVTGIAIIANVVFMMLSLCFALIAAIDLVHSIILLSESAQRADCFAMLLCGIPSGCALAVMLSSVLKVSYGLSCIFTVFGIMALLVGVFSRLLNCFKMKAI